MPILASFHSTRTWKVRKEGYIPHGKLRTFTCGRLRSIGTLCPQVYASWKFFSVRTSAIFPYAGRQLSAERSAEVCGRLRTSMRTSADIFADVYVDVHMDWCGRPHGLARTSAWMGADVCGSPHGWVRTSAGPEDLLELLPLLCNNLLIICGITWSYAVWLSFNVCST